MVNGVSDQVSPGVAFLLSPADFHAFEPVGDQSLDCCNVVVHPELVERTLESVQPEGELGLPWSITASPGIGGRLPPAAEEASERRSGWDIVRRVRDRARMIVELARSSVGPHADPEAVDAGPPAHDLRELCGTSTGTSESR